LNGWRKEKTVSCRQSFMESESLQKPAATGALLDPLESGPHFHILRSFNIDFNVILPTTLGLASFLPMLPSDFVVVLRGTMSSYFYT
jgi:hypothetical protein